MNNVIQNKKLPLLEMLFIMYYAFLAINPKMNVQVPLINFLLIELAYAVYIYYRDLSIRHLVSTFLWCSLIIALLFTFTTSIPYIGANVPNREIKSLVTMRHSVFSLVFPILLNLCRQYPTCHVQLYKHRFRNFPLILPLLPYLSSFFPPFTLSLYSSTALLYRYNRNL